MRVDPQHPSGAVVSHAAHGADGDGVIAADEDGDAAFLARLFSPAIGLFANLLHSGKEPELLLIGHRVPHQHGDVARVFDLVAELLQVAHQSRVTHSARPHVHATQRLAEVGGDADDANGGLGGHGVQSSLVSTYLAPSFAGETPPDTDSAP